MRVSWILGLIAAGVAACGGGDAHPLDGSGGGSGGASTTATSSSSGGAGGGGGGVTSDDLPVLSFCKQLPGKLEPAAFQATTGSDWVSYACTQPCADWQDCEADAVDAGGQPIFSQRDHAQLKALSFVVDGMAGRITYTADGETTIVGHTGTGGVSPVFLFVQELQKATTAKTVFIQWQPGWSGLFPGEGAGWFTRTSPAPTTLPELTKRVASVLVFVHDHLAQGNPVGTVACSMGTAATLGPVVWNGLDPIIDYQMFIGGPALWDVDAGCGRTRPTAGHCDVDAAPCQGTSIPKPIVDDPECPAGPASNRCRVPAGIANSNYATLFDNLYQTDQCAQTTQDAPYPPFATSSMRSTPGDWDWDSAADFLADEGTQDGVGDEYVGEGHMASIYASVSGDKAWIDDDGGAHCDSWSNDPQALQAAVQRVIARMGL